MSVVIEVLHDVLTNHKTIGVGKCSCGWESLSLSRVEHVVREFGQALRAAEELAKIPLWQRNPEPVAVGERIHGYCGGHFGRDHYKCGTVEAVGNDWLVLRIDEAYDDDAQPVASATGENILMMFREYRVPDHTGGCTECDALNGY